MRNNVSEIRVELAEKGCFVLSYYVLSPAHYVQNKHVVVCLNAPELEEELDKLHALNKKGE